MTRIHRPLLVSAAALLLCAAGTLSRGQTPPQRTESSTQCGPANPGGPCYGSGLPECWNPNGRCVSTEALCRFDWNTGGSCSAGTCLASGVCGRNPTTPTPTPSGDCTFSGCPSGQRCVATHCVGTATTTTTGGSGGCAGSPARRS